jgi:sensor c-di-GMP phosphodiesterase-like protein
LIVSLGQRSRWFVAEFVVIIVGVLVALAIDEWRDTLQAEEREQEYLRQLAADLRATRDMFAEAAEDNAQSENAAARLTEIFESDSDVELNEVRRLLAEARYFNNPVPILGTAEALVSTGDLRLIGNSRVRSELTRYLSRSRDFWLFPLYQLEEQHRNVYMNIILLAQRYGVTPEHVRGPSAQIGNADLEGFLADSDAYVYISRYAQLKAGVAKMRDAMSEEAGALAALL